MSNAFVISTKSIFFVPRVFLAAVVRRIACQLWRDFYTNFHGEFSRQFKQGGVSEGFCRDFPRVDKKFRHSIPALANLVLHVTIIS